ncbi:MAG: hypothetical protein ACLQPD_25920 [Desulfomonilaceae bacterium]
MEANPIGETKVAEVVAPEDLDTAEVTDSTLRIKSPKAPFSLISREVREEELDQPGVKRLLIHLMDRLEERVGELKDFQNLYYAENRKSAILEEKVKRSRSHEIVSAACFVIVGPIFGVTITIWKTNPEMAYVLSAVGIALLASGILAKVVKL